jgi:Tfp pilus assembly protein PilX
MKTHPHHSKTRRSGFRQRGFALIATLSLMILLTVIAVGLLTLSSISLRSSSQGSGMATAKANARMALMLALGDLQKYAGPDQRVTARADVTDENIANPRLTGVWKSWDMQASDDSSKYQQVQGDKKTNGKFLGWLASSLDGKASSQFSFAGTSTGTDPKKSVPLWGKGSLGTAAPAKDFVTALKVATSTRGAYAYAVMDEGVKARINTPFFDEFASSSPKGARTTQLGSGQRPNTSAIPTLSKLEERFYDYSGTTFATIKKGITHSNLGLAAETLAPGSNDLLKPLLHDVTSTSVGLFTDTAKGGLKEDFSLLTNNTTLPAPYNDGKGIYESRLGMNTSRAPSDPRWESLQQYAGIYRDNNASSGRLVTYGGVPLIKAQGPNGWSAATDSILNRTKPAAINSKPPAGVVLMPVIAKVQVVFSLLTRDIYSYPRDPNNPDTTPKVPADKDPETTAQYHNPWGNNFAGSDYDYLLHLLYTPVVTLHNPYNVAIEVKGMQVIFANVPFGVQVWRNGVAQTTAPAPLDKMYNKAEDGKLSKRFGMSLFTNGGSASNPSVGSSTLRMLPGEVLMFSPFITPTAAWTGGDFTDWNSSSTDSAKTLAMKGIPGWRGDGLGYDLDWFAPADLRVDDYEHETSPKPKGSMWRAGCIGARAIDEFSVKFAPLSVPGLSNNKFTVEMFAQSTTSTALISSGLIEMDYESPTGLQDTLIGPGGTITYPKSGTINTMAMHSHRLSPMNQVFTVKPFAIVSAQGKTTLGGLDVNGEDGKLATKPWAFGHAAIGSVSEKMVSENPAHFSHELSLQRLDNGTINLLQFDYNTGRSNFISGLTTNTGLKFGSMYDIPLTPIQSLAGLNGANPGGSSAYLPRFAQPIGNSWAHPMLDPTKISTPGGTYPYLDHSFLLNLALYDHFYFSGLANQTGTFASGKSTNSLVQEFVSGRPLTDPRIGLYQPDGKPVTELTTEVNAAATAHTKIAAWQVMNGAFNINSTSVSAWKAMLGSIHDAKSVLNKINKTGKTSAFSDLPVTDTAKNEVRISRFRMPASESADDGADSKDAYWLGPREYTEAQLQKLAENIVKQVRARGPFLSMSEFVNRQLGPSSDEKAQRGALQQAIDDSDLNNSNATSANAGWQIPESVVSKYKNAKAGAGASNQGAPGYLIQADLLTVLGNAATPRSDTFTIRGYGEARDAANNPIATAVCEATVQRVPEFIDSADKADVVPASLTSVSNKTFGRRFQIVSFRWLSTNEI